MAIHGGDLDVVVVNWNTGGYLASCLESVYASAKGADWLGRVIAAGIGNCTYSQR
jgi:hypothetical protein